jgi:hypothetical protein
MPKPVIVPLVPSASATAHPAEPAIPVVVELQMCAILMAPIGMNETIDRGFARKECELTALFGSLTPLQARTLHRRLANPRTDDSVATLFARLVAERRTRLLVFLAGARRRAAIREAQA